MEVEGYELRGFCEEEGASIKACMRKGKLGLARRGGG